MNAILINGANVSTYNSIDNFYEPAPCGQTRQLKSGILLVANTGKMDGMIWVSTTCPPHFL
jgi:hypothetical protein